MKSLESQIKKSTITSEKQTKLQKELLDLKNFLNDISL